MLSRLLLGAHNIAVHIYKNSFNESWNNITVQPGSFYGSAVERKFELVTEDLELRRTSWNVARHRTPAGFLSLSALITPAEYIAARFIQSGNTLLLIVGMGLANGLIASLKRGSYLEIIFVSSLLFVWDCCYGNRFSHSERGDGQTVITR